MTEQRRPGRYQAELRERTVRMVIEVEAHMGSQWEAICSVSEKGGPTLETVRGPCPARVIGLDRHPELVGHQRRGLSGVDRPWPDPLRSAHSL